VPEALIAARGPATLEERPDAGITNELIVNPGNAPRETVTGVAGVLVGVTIGGLVIGVITTGAWVGTGVGAGVGAGAGTETEGGPP
jgi:hypothetical protein